MEHLKIKSFGPIEEADVHFGDLTLLVGPQASGKSIFIQLLKFLVDKHHIRKTLLQYNYIWDKDTEKILDLYFGEGMSKIWKDNSKIQLDGKTFDKSFLLLKATKAEDVFNQDETLFYIPAQRIFPISNQLIAPLRKSFNDSIFHDGKVVMDDRTGQRKLRMEVEGMSVPFITWSAGQKEFLPLLLGFYWLCPPSKVSRKDDFKYVVIEEPEMGLHPQAIKSVMLQIIDLLSRDYKVIVSTHSPVLLEFVWAFNLLQKSKVKDDTLFELFDIPKNAGTKGLFEGILSKKKIKTYYFDRKNEKVIAKDISSLDAGSEDEAMSSWGGLSSFFTTQMQAQLK